MLLANYASDSDSDSESGPSRPAPAAPAPKAAVAAKKRKGPVKIGLDLPKPAKEDKEEVEEEEEDRSFKKAKTGAGSSSLLGMLPPPKRKLPTASKSTLAVNKSMARPSLPKASTTSSTAVAQPQGDSDYEESGSGLMMPATLKRAAAKNKPAADLDLFGLSTPTAPAPKTVKETPRPPSISAAPPVADFVPPEPTAADPYPGYYQLPGGAWAAYDPTYYASFFAPSADSELQAEHTKKKDRTGRAWADLDDGRAAVLEVNANDGLAEARIERERQALLQKPKVNKDEYTYEEIGQTRGLAAERHQLTSLLSSAFSQREELEARIAENKKKLKMGAAKYGF